MVLPGFLAFLVSENSRGQSPSVIISWCGLPRSLVCRWSRLGFIKYRFRFQLWRQEGSLSLLGLKGRIRCWSWMLNHDWRADKRVSFFFFFPVFSNLCCNTVRFCVSVWFCFCSVFDFSGRGLNMKAPLSGVSMATDEAQRPLFFFLCFHLGLSHNLREKKIITGALN